MALGDLEVFDALGTFADMVLLSGGGGGGGLYNGCPTGYTNSMLARGAGAVGKLERDSNETADFPLTFFPDVADEG